LAAIADPRWPDGHYLGLELAKLRWPHLSKPYRSAIQSGITGGCAPHQARQCQTMDARQCRACHFHGQ
jgi:hypothetical protein